MNKTDAQDYRDAAELIASKVQNFACLALENTRDSPYQVSVERPDLVKPFLDTFSPGSGYYHVVWREGAHPGCPTRTDSADHSRECRVFALLLMAEMIENP